MNLQLAVIRGLVRDIEDNGRIVEIIERVPSNTAWAAPEGDFFDPEEGDGYAVVSCGRPFRRNCRDGGFSMYACFFLRNVYPIRDRPGNEHFVVEARKSLPRPATAKGDTITERGELA